MKKLILKISALFWIGMLVAQLPVSAQAALSLAASISDALSKPFSESGEVEYAEDEDNDGKADRIKFKGLEKWFYRPADKPDFFKEVKKNKKVDVSGDSYYVGGATGWHNVATSVRVH